VERTSGRELKELSAPFCSHRPAEEKHVATDALVSSELKSLQDELAAGKADRAARTDPVVSPAVGSTASADAPQKPLEEIERQDYLRQLADEITELFGKAETSISAHPAQSVAGALLLGILIGRLLGRR
jgi:ElaB/YqjD/DUF883 family membrane-anchored ribosome-binding protein